MNVRLRQPWLVGLLATAAYFLLSGAWALALPVNGTYDENQHIVRAYAVVTGQWLPDGETTDAAGLPAEAFDAPGSLLPANAACTWKPKPPRPASCQVPVTDRARTTMPSQAARYSPVYYAMVGLPLRVSPDETGVVLARLLSALIAAAMLGVATAIAFRMGSRLVIAGIVLVCTPTTMNLAGSINPNGLEIIAGVLLFVGLLALLRARDPLWATTPEAAGEGRPAARRRGVASAMVAVVVAACLVLTMRQLSGPLMLAGIVAVSLLVARWDRVAELARNRRALVALCLPVVASGVFAMFWLVYSKVLDVKPMPGKGLPYSAAEVLRRVPGDRMRFYVDQVVARFSYGETGVSEPMILAWYALVAAVVLPALWFGGTRLRVAVVGIVTVCLIMLIEREIHFIPTHGWYSQSRYVMPLGVGCVLIAASSDRVAAWLRSFRWWRWAVPLLIAATAPLDMYAIVRVMTRFQVGIEASVDPFGGSWHPTFGSASVLIAASLGVMGLVGVAIVAVPPVTDDVVNG